MSVLIYFEVRLLKTSPPPQKKTQAIFLCWFPRRKPLWGSLILKDSFTQLLHKYSLNAKSPRDLASMKPSWIPSCPTPNQAPSSELLRSYRYVIRRGTGSHTSKFLKVKDHVPLPLSSVSGPEPSSKWGPPRNSLTCHLASLRAYCSLNRDQNKL